jgi:membrane protease YdiL (CAAX protease family)
MVSSSGGRREHLHEDDGRAPRWVGAILLLAGPPVGLLTAAHAWERFLAAVLALALTGAGAFLLRRTWWALGLTGIAAAVTATRHPGPYAWAAVLVLSALSALVALLARRRPGTGIRLTDGLWALLLMVLLSTGVTLLTGLTSAQVAERSTELILLVYLITPPLEVAAILLVLIHAGAMRSFLQRQYRWGAGLGRQLAEGFTWGIAIILLTTLVVSLESKWFHVAIEANNPFVYSPGLTHPTWLDATALAAAVVVLAPLAEEALFRGLLYGGLRTRLPAWLAAVISAVLFGGAHMNASLFLPLALAGLILAMVYERTHSLWPSTVAHATLNGISVLLALLVR